MFWGIEVDKIANDEGVPAGMDAAINEEMDGKFE